MYRYYKNVADLLKNVAELKFWGNLSDNMLVRSAWTGPQPYLPLAGTPAQPHFPSLQVILESSLIVKAAMAATVAASHCAVSLFLLKLFIPLQNETDF